MVRQIEASAVSPCEFLGVVTRSEGLAWTIAGGRRNVFNQIRNQVAEMSGNA